MAEIFAQRVRDRVLVADDQSDRAVEPFDALLGARRAFLDMGLTLTLEHARQSAAASGAVRFVLSGLASATLMAISLSATAPRPNDDDLSIRAARLACFNRLKGLLPTLAAQFHL